MTIENNACPKCGSTSFDTIRHSWRDGVTPFEDYYECCSCDHSWHADDLKEKTAQEGWDD
jgi:DNA-directed RNA polymerase subunit M/transcription elongation factor TFIIS